MTKSPFALSLSKGMSEWAQGRFDKLRTGRFGKLRTGRFDKLSPSGG